MQNCPSLLIADDDRVLSAMLAEYLSAEGYQISLAENGREAVQLVATTDFDLVVLDIMMPLLDGVETLKQIRASTEIPVIMLTARGDDLDRILGLELGADDYLAKPCNPRELLARIKAVLRRVQGKLDSGKVIQIGDLSLDPRSRAVTVDQHAINLTQTEFDLLHLLISNPGEVVSKKTLSKEVLGKPLSQWDRSIDVHVSNLRKKIGTTDSSNVHRIRTVRGAGYLYTGAASTDRPA